MCLLCEFEIRMVGELLCRKKGDNLSSLFMCLLCEFEIHMVEELSCRKKGVRLSSLFYVPSLHLNRWYCIYFLHGRWSSEHIFCWILHWNDLWKIGVDSIDRKLSIYLMQIIVNYQLQNWRLLPFSTLVARDIVERFLFCQLQEEIQIILWLVWCENEWFEFEERVWRRISNDSKETQNSSKWECCRNKMSSSKQP